jgi:adenylyl cyclase-associated protein
MHLMINAFFLFVQEYQKGRKDLVIDQVEMNNVVYMFKCEDCVMTVKGKLNSVVMDSCRKSALVFDSVVSSIEFVNCQSVQMQV